MEASADLFDQLETIALGTDRRSKAVTSGVVLPVDGTGVKTNSRKTKTTDTQKVVLNALRTTMAKCAEKRRILPDMANMLCITRDQLKDELRVKGFYEEITQDRARGKLRDALEALENKGLAFSTDRYVWCPCDN